MSVIHPDLRILEIAARQHVDGQEHMELPEPRVARPRMADPRV